MRLGYITQDGRGGNDRVLTDAAALAEAAGLRLAGCVQSNTERPGVPPESHDCDMDLRVLGGGPVVRINQRLGEGSRGCRLDPGALEVAVGEVEARMTGAEALIVNKFGKHECEGRGFRLLIAEALAGGLPVVLGVNRMNLEAFREFTGDAASELEPTPSAVVEFLLAPRA